MYLCCRKLIVVMICTFSLMMARLVKSFPMTVTCQTRLATRLYASSADASKQSSNNIAIVGGGLAGLGLAHALLEQQAAASICIYDTIAQVGQGGASAVAGGLVHPLSPRGKLVHWGREGIDATSRLVAAAAQQEPNCILRDKLYRVAMTDRNVEDMAKTLETNKNNVKDYCRWVDKDELDTILGSTKTMGGLELSNGCSVIHVPTYLKGLYAACQEIGTIEWRPAADLDIDSHDVVVWAGGAGMLQDGTFDQTKLPVDMVRGQSLELKPSADAKDIAREAALCGKYTSPLLDNRMLVGATHEFAEEALSQDELYQELKDRSYDLSPNLWDYSTVDRVTCGYRVQSQRGALGRLPIVGHLTGNQWVFTGLSSRGLLYHGVYGGKLAEMILSGDQGESIVTENPHLNWWK